MFQEKLLCLSSLYTQVITPFLLYPAGTTRTLGTYSRATPRELWPEQELLFILLLWLPCLGDLLLIPVSPPATRLTNAGRKNPPTKPQINPKQDHVNSYCPREDLQITKQPTVQA